MMGARQIPSGEQRGFTYLWVMLAVVMIGLGMTAAAEVQLVVEKRQKEKELLFVGRQIRDAIGRYYEAAPTGLKEYPANLEALLQDPRTPDLRRYLRKIYVDPMTGRGEWGIFEVGGRIAGVYSRSAEKPIKQDRFDPSEESFVEKKKYSEWVFAYASNQGLQPSSGQSAGLLPRTPFPQ